MRLPKLVLRKGRYIGMRGVHEAYSADYYHPDDVAKYKREAELLLALAKQLKQEIEASQ